MINTRLKLHDLFLKLSELPEPSQLDGFNEFNLLEAIKQKAENVPIDSFNEFINFIYKNSGLSIEKSVPLLKLNDILFSKNYQIFVFKKPGQIGATTYFTTLFAYMFIKYKLPMLFVSVDSGKADIVQNQLACFLQNIGVKVLIREPDFMLTNIGIIYFAYSTSPKSFRSKPAAFIFIDEAAAMPPNIGGEGDVITLSLARTTTFANIRKIFVFSTPTHEKSFLEKYFEKAEKYFVYKLKCPHCGFLIEPAVSDIVDNESLLCSNCKNAFNRIEAINGGEWCGIDGDSHSGIIAMRINLLCSPLANLDDIKYRYQLAEHDMMALRSFLNLVMAEEYRMGENTFPQFIVGTLQECEEEVVLYAADPHHSDVHVIEIAFRSDGYILIKNGYVMTHAEFMEFCKKVPYVIIDVGYLSNTDIASIPQEVRSKFIQVRGSFQRMLKGQYLIFARSRYAGVHFIFRQDVLMRLYRLAMDGRIYISEAANDAVKRQIMIGISKMAISVDRRTGKYYWNIPEEFHEYSHFVDCIIYAVAIYEHYKNTDLIKSLTSSLKQACVKKVEGLKLTPVRIL